MDDDAKSEVLKAVIVAAIGLAGVAVQYALTSQAFRIEVRARLAGIQGWWDRYRADHSLADEMRAQAEAAQVVEAAEAITREGVEADAD